MLEKTTKLDFNLTKISNFEEKEYSIWIEYRYVPHICAAMNWSM